MGFLERRFRRVGGVRSFGFCNVVDLGVGVLSIFWGIIMVLVKWLERGFSRVCNYLAGFL